MCSSPGVSLKFSNHHLCACCSVKFSCPRPHLAYVVYKASLHLQHRPDCKFLPATKAPLSLPCQLAKPVSLDCSPTLQLDACSPAHLLTCFTSSSATTATLASSGLIFSTCSPCTSSSLHPKAVVSCEIPSTIVYVCD